MEENGGWQLDRARITPSHTPPTSGITPPHLCPESRSSPALSLHCLLEEMEHDRRPTSGSPPPWITPISLWEPSAGPAAPDEDLAPRILPASFPSPDVSLTPWSRHEVRTSPHPTLLPRPRQTDR